MGPRYSGSSRRIENHVIRRVPSFVLQFLANLYCCAGNRIEKFENLYDYHNNLLSENRKKKSVRNFSFSSPSVYRLRCLLLSSMKMYFGVLSEFILSKSSLQFCLCISFYFNGSHYCKRTVCIELKVAYTV